MTDQVQDAPVDEVVIDETATAPENAETPSDETEASKEVKEAQAVEAKTFTQEEVDRIAQKERNKAERKAAREYEAKLDALARQQPAKPEPEVKRNDAPRIEDFKDVEEYLDARDAWRDQKREAEAQQQKTQLKQRELTETTEKLYAKAETYEGFDREVFDGLVRSPAMASAIIECDDAPKVMAYLVNNPEEAERIADLKPSKQAAAIVKLEEELTAKKPVAVSKAPAPIKPIGSRGGATQKAPAEMSQKDFEKWLYGK